MPDPDGAADTSCTRGAQPVETRRTCHMRFRLLTSLTALVLGIVIPVTARQGDSPQLLFEAGHKAEVVDGDLRGAIRQYQAALQRFGTNRTVAAEALSRMATAYEKLGDP